MAHAILFPQLDCEVGASEKSDNKLEMEGKGVPKIDEGVIPLITIDDGGDQALIADSNTCTHRD